jgi:hypothetical protein
MADLVGCVGMVFCAKMVVFCYFVLALVGELIYTYPLLFCLEFGCF